MDVYGYEELQVDLTKPAIALTQNNDSVSADSTLTLTDYKHFTSSANPDCSENYTGWGSADTGQTAGNIDDGHYVCFRAKNSLDVYGYNKLQVDLTQPDIELNQNNNSVIASGVNLDDYKYFTDNGNPDCDKDDTYTGSGQTAPNIDHNHYVLL